MGGDLLTRAALNAPARFVQPITLNEDKITRMNPREIIHLIQLIDAVYSLIDRLNEWVFRSQPVQTVAAPTVNPIDSEQIAADFAEILDQLNEGLADWGASVEALNTAIGTATAATNTFNDLFLAFEKAKGEKLRELGEGFEAFTAAVSRLDLEQLDAVRATVDELLEAALEWRKLELARPRRTSEGGGRERHAANPFAPVAGMAHGGPVAAFRPYMVGEQGPELFVPRLPGAIVPNHAHGATQAAEGRAVNQTVVFNVLARVPEAVRGQRVAPTPGFAFAA